MAREVHRRGVTSGGGTGVGVVTTAVAVVCFFLATASPASPLHAAAARDDHQTMVTLLAAGVDANAADAHGDTPLHKAALHDAATATALLLAHAADARAQNRFGATPLHYAAANDAVAVAALLGNAGADVNAADRHDHTPLHWAARDGAVNAADWLSRRGAAAVSGWWWFYNDKGAVSWRRGKELFDDEIKNFVKLETKRTDELKRASAIKNTATGIISCTVAAAGCTQAVTNAATRLLYEIGQINKWESALKEINKNKSVHNVRFLVPPNEQSRTVRIDGAQPFTRYVGKVTTNLGFCTAFLVHPKIAMTNAHCVCRDRKCRQRVSKTTMKLTFARKDLTGKHDITARVKQVRVNDWSGGFDADFAFLILQRAPKIGGHLEVAPNAGNTTVIATAGYPGDLLAGEVMTALWGCPLRVRSNILFFASPDCHRYGGASGSPYIAADGRHRGKVVGVHSFSPHATIPAGGGPSVRSFYPQFLQAVAAAESR